MTDCIEWRYRFDLCGVPRVPPGVRSKLWSAAIAVAALACGASFALRGSNQAEEDAAPVAHSVAAPRSDSAAARFESRFYLGLEREAQSTNPAPLRNDTAAESRPAPAVQPSSPAAAHVAARSPSPLTAHAAEPRWRQNRQLAMATSGQQNPAGAPAETPNFLQKLFGSKQSSIFATLFGSSPSGATLAYATPEAGVAGDGSNITGGLYDRETAVYDISAHTVYLPDGTALEAHSGLGFRLDDPRYVNERNRGPTPPDVYDLQMREAPFHGVHALRLIPIDNTRVFGRSGLLAHSYMLGSNGQSNGCVSFKDYDAFLQAYLDRRIKRLAVVSRVD